MRLLEFFIDVAVRTGEAVQGLAKVDRASDRTKANLNRVGAAAVAAGDRMLVMGERAATMGTNLSLFVTDPLLLLGTKAAQAAREADTAFAVVEQRIRTMGAAAGFTAEQLRDMAGGIMAKSLYDDDQVLQDVTSNLLTYGAVAGDTFARAQRAIVDLAAAKKQDLAATTDAVGKALSSAKGAAALSRTGTLLPDDIARVKALYEQNNQLEAQRVILAAIERQYGGTAAIIRAQNPEQAAALDAAQAMEVAGAAVNRIIQKLLPYIARFSVWVSSLSEDQMDLAVGLLAAAAAAGPLLSIFGGLMAVFGPLVGGFGRLTLFLGKSGLMSRKFVVIMGRMGRMFGPLRTGFMGLIRLVPLLGRALLGLALNPVGAALLALAAVGLIIYNNWEQIAPMWEQLSAAFSDIWAEMSPQLTKLKNEMIELWNGEPGEMLRALGAFLVGAFIGQIKFTLTVVIQVVRFIIYWFSQLATIVTGVIRIVKALIHGDWEKAWQAAKDMVGKFVDNALGFLDGLIPGAKAAFKGMYDEAKLWLDTKFKEVVEFFGRNVRRAVSFLPGGTAISAGVGAYNALSSPAATTRAPGTTVRPAQRIASAPVSNTYNRHITNHIEVASSGSPQQVARETVRQINRAERRNEARSA